MLLSWKFRLNVMGPYESCIVQNLINVSSFSAYPNFRLSHGFFRDKQCQAELGSIAISCFLVSFPGADSMNPTNDKPFPAKHFYSHRLNCVTKLC